MGNDHRGQVVVVTGASGGIGRAAAVAFGRKGDKVALIARGRAGLEGACKEIESVGGTALPIQADVARPEEIEAAAEKIEATLGPIDVWVNNAMVSVFSPVKDMTPEEFKRVTEVTYLGYVYGTLSALKRMLTRNRGVIVQVGSALAYRSIPLQSAYCGAKHAIAGFTDSLRSELEHDGSRVRVTMVQMPAVNTPQFEWVKSRLPRRPQPVPPIFQPEVAAEAVVWASEHSRREVMVGTPTLAAIEANKVAPGLLDRYLAWTGYDSQQTDQLDDHARPDNLFAPADEERDYGMHGRFDMRSSPYSAALWFSEHRTELGVAAAGLTALLWALARRNR